MSLCMQLAYCHHGGLKDNNLMDNKQSNAVQVDLNFELERLRLELKHVKGMYTVAQTEKMEASRQVFRIFFYG